MEEEIRTGFYLQKVLSKKGVTKKEITSLITFILKVPEDEYAEDFEMSSDVRFALKGIKEVYTGLSRKYEPTLEYVIFNGLIHKDIINSLTELSGQRNNAADSRIIEVIEKNLMIERFRTKIDDEVKLYDGSLVGQLKKALKKNKII